MRHTGLPGYEFANKIIILYFYVSFVAIELGNFSLKFCNIVRHGFDCGLGIDFCFCFIFILWEVFFVTVGFDEKNTKARMKHMKNANKINPKRRK